MPLRRGYRNSRSCSDSTNFPLHNLNVYGPKGGAVMKVSIIEGEFSDRARIACYDYIITKYIRERMGKCAENEEEESAEENIQGIEDIKLASEIEGSNTVYDI